MASEQTDTKKNANRMEFSNREYFGFATYARSRSGQWRLHFNWRRIAVVFVTLGILGYLLLGLLCHYLMKQEPTAGESLLYPISRETRMNVRKRLGDKIIAEAKVQFSENHDANAYFQAIRAGLMYSPYNPDGRIDFSSLLFFQKRTREAFGFLSDGLPYALNNTNYVQFFVRQSLELAQDDVLSDTAETLLPLFPTAEKILPEPNALRDNHLILTIGAAQANLLRGRFDKASEILKKNEMGTSLSGHVLYAQIAWEQGDRDKALAMLREALSLAPGNEQISLLYSLYLKEAGNLPEARDVLSRLALLKNDPAIRVKILTLFPGEENRAYRESLEENFFERYADDSAALLVFAQYATDTKNYDLVRKVYDYAHKKAHIDLPKFELLRLESFILSGNSDKALKILDELNDGNYAWVKNYQGVIDCLRAIAYYSNGQASLGKISLERVLKNQSVPTARLIVLARRLDELGFEEEAHSVYESAFLLENENQTVLLELVGYALRHENVSVLLRYLPPLLETRRPPRAVLEQVQNFLGSDRMLFVVKRDSLITDVTQMLDKSKRDQVLNTDDTALQSWF